MTSSVAHPPTGAGLQRFANGFGRAAGVLAVLGLAIAVAMTFAPGWFDLGGSDDGPTYEGIKASQPVRVTMGDASVVAPLIASARDPLGTVTSPPDDVPLVTWWQDSAKPGAPRGQTVLTAHAAPGQPGGLSAMAGLQEGDFVDLLTRTGTMRYEVTAVRTLGPQKFSRASLGYMKQDGGGGRLVAISAEGWDGTAYQSTVVLTAEPLGQPEETPAG